MMENTEKQESYWIPDTLSHWPWPRQIHPDAQEVVAASAEWFRSFTAFNPQSQRAFDRCNVGLAGALAYPFSNKELLRTACDMYNLFFVVDHYTDVEDADGCRPMVDAVIDALQNPRKPRPHGEVILGEITRQFWMNAKQTGAVGPLAQRRFVQYFAEYMNSMVNEAADREHDVYRSVEEYLALRRKTVGYWPQHALILLELPDEVAYHPAMAKMSSCLLDMVIIDNDIISYNTEQCAGDARHNLVTATMLERKVHIDAAIIMLLRQHEILQERFLETYKAFEPCWDLQTNQQLQEVLRSLVNIPRGLRCWHFECGRYFGSKGAVVYESQRVPLLPPLLNGVRRREDVFIPVIDEVLHIFPEDVDV